jgi:phosphonoacetate hydrolase
VSVTDSARLEVNGREYALPDEPVVVVCVDGSEPAYHERAVAAGRMPFVASIQQHTQGVDALCTMPSFTNPNNLSIATGVPPAVHGICGNYFFDVDRGVEVMMNEPDFLRAPTIFAAFEEAGVDVAVVTAKDKLRRLLGAGLTKGVCFSAEKAAAATVDENGIDAVLDLVGRPLPSVYSSELSEFVMVAGVRLLETRRPRLMYLSLSDHLQHKFAPDTAEALDFYSLLDAYFARLDELGAVLVVTADHGMNAKSTADGKPNVVYLQEHLDQWLGAGRSRVVLPITDPYTVHHAALGSFAFVHLDDDVDRAAMARQVAALPGVTEAIVREEACHRYELPADRIGDLSVVGDRHVALGTSPDRHDLSQLERPLRSHGGLTEQRVPLIVNRPLRPLPDGHELRNFDAFWLGLNFAERGRG